MRFINKSLIGALVLFLIGWAPAQVKNKEERGSRAKIIQVEPSLLRVNLKATTGNPGKSKYPLSESFESTFPPYGWTVVTNGVAGNNGWQQTSLQAHTGTYSAYHNDDNVDGLCSSWLISPPLYISNADTLLSFWQYQHYGSYFLYHGIWVDTTAGTDTTNFFELQSLSAGTEITWEEVLINLSTFVGDTITIAFKYQGDWADEWYIDDVSGPEVVLPDTVGPVISIIKTPSHHFYTGVGDSVFASIVDPSGVSGADLYYSIDLGASWNSIPMTNVTGDTFVAIIPVVDRGSKVAWYILAQDNSGNSSISDTYVYNIMPSGENLIVYSTGDELSPYMQAIWATGIEPSPDIMYSGDVPTYADSLPLWTTIYWGEISSLSDGEQNALINFLKSGTGSDRKHLIISGDDIGYYEHETEFYNLWLRARYIKDDLSSLMDNDTIVGITGDGISDGMPLFTISSDYPDMVEPYSPYGDMDISWKFLIATTGDSVNTAGGLAYNGLTYIAEYLPYEISEIDSQKYVDTLILRIHNFNSTAELPPIADWANTQWPHSTTVNVGDSTELIFGQIWEQGLTDVGLDVNKDSIRAQLGFGPDGSIPYEEETLWTWVNAIFNVISGNNYEYMAKIYADSSLLPGHYDYCFRYSIKEGGVWGPWIYADLNGTGTKEKAYNYNYDPSQAGDLVVQKGYPILTIPEIQDTTGTGSDASAHEGDTVATFGIVTGVYSNGFFLEEKPAAPWAGIWVYTNTAPTVSVGDSIYISAVVAEYNGLTELGNIQEIVVLASGVSLPDPISVTTGGANDESYEGVLLTVQGVCTNPDLGYGEWQIDDGTGPLRVDDKGVAFVPDSGVEYVVTGPLYYSYGNFKLEPRDSSDIVYYPLLTIPQIQDTTGTGSDASAHVGDTVATIGVVTGVYSNGFFLEEKPAAPWAGIWVYTNTAPTVSVGDSIYISAVVAEYNGLTELGNIQEIVVLASGVSLPDPISVTTGGANDESYEGVLLTVQGVCTNPDLGYGEWQIDDGTGPLRVDDKGVAFVPDSGVEYVVTGPLYYSYGNFKLEPRDSSDIVPTGADEGFTELPRKFMLGPVYPNPSRGKTVIRYALPKDAHVIIEIYDIAGKKVKTLVNAVEKAGWKTAIWNGTNERGEKVKSGIYFYRMKADKFLKTRKMVYLK